jgi:hypothetical protein
MCGLTFAAPPPGTPQAPPAGQGQARTGTQGAPASGEGAAPNDDFIEFLGADDVGDAAWWEFLNKSAPHRAKPPAPSPPDSKS